MGNPLQKQYTPKSYHDHFLGIEMEAIAAHVYNRQRIPRYQYERLSELNRAWPKFDRFIRACRTFQEYFNANPDKNLSFKIAFYDIANSRIESGDVRLDPRETERALVAWNAIMNWDVKKLQEYSDGIPGRVNDAYRFTKLAEGEFAPLEMDHGSMSTFSIEQLAAQDGDKPKTQQSAIESVAAEVVAQVPKQRGRPKKVVVA